MQVEAVNKWLWVTMKMGLKYIVVNGGIYFYVSGKEIKLQRVLPLNAVFLFKEITVSLVI
jgi:hypothetical protein